MVLGLKTYILQKNESLLSIQQKANELSLDYEIIHSEKELEGKKDEMFVFLQDSFVLSSLESLQDIEHFMKEYVDWDYLFLGCEPEILTHTSVKKFKNISRIFVPSNIIGYIQNGKKKKVSTSTLLYSVYPPILTNCPPGWKKLLFDFKNWYSHKIGFQFGHLLLVIAMSMIILKMFMTNFEKKYAKQVILNSL